MFGMGFTEILVIIVVAILFLGPDKLPTAMIEIAKFFRSMKQTVNNVKESINEEIHLEDIKKEAQEYKEKLLEAQAQIHNNVNLNALHDEISSLVDEKPKPSQPTAKKINYKEPSFSKNSSEELNQQKESKDA